MSTPRQATTAKVGARESKGDFAVGEPLAVGIKLGSREWRYFHGVVTSFAKSRVTHLYTRYAARLHPSLSELVHAADCRIFNDPAQNAVSIVTEVLAERGLTEAKHTLLLADSISAHANRGGLRERALHAR
jgi:uncharacterized protein involved in type VI secretion and phage assembly